MINYTHKAPNKEDSSHKSHINLRMVYKMQRKKQQHEERQQHLTLPTPLLLTQQNKGYLFNVVYQITVFLYVL